MPEIIETIEVSASGEITKRRSREVPELYVMSDEIAPVGEKRGSRAFIIDKFAVAVCTGDDRWYIKQDGQITVITSGQAWSTGLT